MQTPHPSPLKTCLNFHAPNLKTDLFISFLLIGAAGFIAMLLGTGTGGAVLRWGRPRPRYVAGYNIFVTIFVALSFFVLIFLGCPKLHVIGPLEG